MTILSVDPGENVGYATFSEHGKALSLNESNDEDFMDRLIEYEGSELSAIVFESYRLRQGKQMAQTGSKFRTSQVIGECKLLARRLKIPYYEQSPQILHITAKHMRISLGVGHIPDRTSALLHGYRFLIETRKIDTGVLRALNGLE